MDNPGSLRTERIHFPNGQSALAVITPTDAAPHEIIAALALPAPRGLVILNGGTARLEPALQTHLAAALQDGLARVVAEEGFTAITGGTDAGIFGLFGEGLARWGRRAPCIGVNVASLVSYPGKAAGDAPLEPNHSHFVMVAGEHWGDETATMYALIMALGRQCPTVAVFASGGEICIHEMQMNVAQGRRMILLAGSGRATDQVLAARAGQPVADARLSEIAANGDITRFDLTGPPSALSALIHDALLIAD